MILLRDGVRITHGDVVVTSRSGQQYTDQRITLLMGEVKIDQNELHMEGDEGEYHRFADKAILRGNVRILDDGWDLRCDEAVYFRTTEKAYLRGNVVAIETASTLRCDSLFYDKQRAIAEVFGNVEMDNAEEGVRARGQHAFYFRDSKEGLIDRLPFLIVDPESPEPTNVVSDTMRFFPDGDRAVAIGRVKITKGNTITQADTAFVFDQEQRAELYGRPLARQENMSMQGDRMILFYDEEEVRRITLVGSAVITEENPDTLVRGRDSWVRGDSMVLHVYRSHLDSIDVIGSATSDYYPQSSARRIEANYARGNRMFFLFDKDSLAYVNVTGKASGTYRYLDLKGHETVDSLRAVSDTSLTYVPFGEKSDKVAYFADSLEYYARSRDLVLDRNAKVDYRDRTLTGDHIKFNADLEVLDAVGSPVLTEGGDKLYGKQMDYDMETGVGLVSGGSTKFMEGFYDGTKIAKVGDDVLKVWNSKYTTCDLKIPHYHFRSNQMKVYLDDKVVTGPIFLYVGETPVAFLPFFSQNIRRGRRSGILRPDFEFGITSSGTRFIRDIGYFWATNDYTDFLFSGDFNEQESVRLRVENRYRLRYKFDGNVNFSFLRQLKSFNNEWTLSSNHNQTLGEKFTFNSNLRFVSSDRAPRAVSNLDQVANVIDRRIESRISLRKSWETIGFSASARRVQNLNPDTIPAAIRVTTDLPTVTLSIPSRSLYFGRPTKQGDKGFWEEFLGGIRYSPGVNLNRTTVERLYDRTETIRSGQQLNFSSPRRLGVLSVSPQLSMSNTYTRTAYEVFRHEEWLPDSTKTTIPGSRDVVTDNQFRWSTGVGVNTNIYGTFYPEIGMLRGIRHTMAPSASYTLQPRVGSQPSNQTVSFGLSNALDLKVRGANEEQDRKLSGVMIWRLAASYDPDATAKRAWSNISSSLNTSQIMGLTFSINHTIDPYQFDILNTSVTSSFGISGTHGFGTAREAAKRDLNIVASDTTEADRGTESGGGDRREGSGGGRDLRNAGLRWDVNGSFSYSRAQQADPRSTLNVNGSIALTRNWSIRYNANYDVQRRELSGQFFEIQRNLHCWQMSLSRQQLGNEWEYYFRISLVGHQEIYAERGNRGLGSGSTFGTPFQF